LSQFEGAQSASLFPLCTVGVTALHAHILHTQSEVNLSMQRAVIRINTTLFFLLDVIGTYLLLLSISVHLVRNVARMHNKVELQQSVTG
jgi:hypothetical protein